MHSATNLPRSAAVVASSAAWNGSSVASNAGPGTYSMTSTHAAPASCSSSTAARRPSSRQAACAALYSADVCPCRSRRCA